MQNPSPATPTSSRAWYGASIFDFLEEHPDQILGRLAANGDFAVLPTQRDAWLAEIWFLQSQLAGLTGSLFMEFSIPRMGRRIDVVLLLQSIVFVVEFKVGEQVFDRAGLEQVWDYALDLKNYHEASHAATIVLILVATEAQDSPIPDFAVDADDIYRPISTSPTGFRNLLDRILLHAVPGSINALAWAAAPYRPTPTIIEAARALYSQHSVAAIARFDAGAANLQVTSRRVEELVDLARQTNRKLICFVTGVPGAGKTLVGLNVATQRRDEQEATHAVFLSGNGPLVAVLREALTRDEVARQRLQQKTVRKGKVAESVKSFIQNVHHFRDDLLIDPGAPDEHVAIFDEAQRAWNLAQTADFMQRKKKRPGFSQSEPEFLISCLDRHPDWAVVICLVGGGQEINRGEAGIATWIEAIRSKFPHWAVHISSKLTDSEYAAGAVLADIGQTQEVKFDDGLHLAVSMRSFRAENVSGFVKALLDREQHVARTHLRQMAERFPIKVTRDLARAKQWIRNKARGSERFGVVASSKAQRLKPDAIDIRLDVNPVHWFLNDRDDTRSSYYLEDAATEFQVQGLELDWVCVAWDGDLRFSEPGWKYHSFAGNRWRHIKNLDWQRYLLNAYRVLLTRARQGMVIYVPPGTPDDPTRLPEIYDPTYQYLTELGIEEAT